MPLTLSYDLGPDATGNQRTYVRSLLERFGWKRLGGSVFRYQKENGEQEDWLNEVAPSITLFRSYLLGQQIGVSYFTLDANSITRIDHSDPGQLLGRQPLSGTDIPLHTPTNSQSSETRIRRAMDDVAGLFG